MTTTALCLIAAMLTIGLLTGTDNSCKRGYIIFDRIDIHCEIQAVPFAQLSQMKPGEPSAVIRERVIKARNIQTERFSSLPTGEAVAMVIHLIIHACGTLQVRSASFLLQLVISVLRFRTAPLATLQRLGRVADC